MNCTRWAIKLPVQTKAWRRRLHKPAAARSIQLDQVSKGRRASADTVPLVVASGPEGNITDATTDVGFGQASIDVGGCWVRHQHTVDQCLALWSADTQFKSTVMWSAAYSMAAITDYRQIEHAAVIFLSGSMEHARDSTAPSRVGGGGFKGHFSESGL